jgi:MtN3 and saliva related transmembrane protein
VSASPDLIGLIAGLFTSLSSIPQIVRVVRLRSARDLSLTTLLMFGVGLALWLAYGIYLHELPVIIWNGFSLGCYGVLIALKAMELSSTAKATSKRGSTL